MRARRMTGSLSTLIVFLCAGSVMSAAAVPILEKVKTIEDPRNVNLGSVPGSDRWVYPECTSGNFLITEEQVPGTNDAANAIITVSRGSTSKTIVVEKTNGGGRSLLACGTNGTFYYSSALLGTFNVYSAEKLMAGSDPLLTSVQLSPFRSIFDAGDRANASAVMVVQTRNAFVLVEWFHRHDGITDYWHQIFDSSGAPFGAPLGPSDLLVKTTETDPWWILFQGGGKEIGQYAPQALYRLKLCDADSAESATQTIAALRAEPTRTPLGPVTTLSTNRVVNHMVSLLTPSRTARKPVVEFCPKTHPIRAKYWLGSEYDQVLADLAATALLSFWKEREGTTPGENPVDHWFQAEVATQEPMKSVLASFNPLDDRWVASYQQALLKLGGGELDRLYTTYILRQVVTSEKQ